MVLTAAATVREIVGRDAELAALDDSLTAEDGLPAAFLLEGEAGSGKTTIVRSAVRRRCSAATASSPAIPGARRPSSGFFEPLIPLYAFLLARYNPDGTLDASFGGDGLVTTEFPGGRAFGLAMQPDGKIVAAGGGGAGADFALARYLAAGNEKHDVAVAGGFRTKTHLDASRDGLGPFAVVIKVKNSSDLPENIDYATASSEPGTVFSPECSETLVAVPAGRAATVGGCTVTYAGPVTQVLTLTVTHNDADGGVDSDPADNTATKAIVINP